MLSLVALTTLTVAYLIVVTGLAAYTCGRKLGNRPAMRGSQQVCPRGQM